MQETLSLTSFCYNCTENIQFFLAQIPVQRMHHFYTPNCYELLNDAYPYCQDAVPNRYLIEENDME
jgi:hypothetical protein